ncbi:MAG TPA: YkgJ family cysteine cluster protein [Thermoanaerobaculia bacterium]|nr:YkgJ family cysteine cluster protein [Thermoanaerobaculia bacterium]
MIDDLHDEVEARAKALAERHRERMVCRRGCFGCCVDDIFVFEVEATRIQKFAPELLASGTPHPPGRCAFLGSEGECRIYEVRPYVCRTQGLPLRWIDDEAKTEYRDICPLNDESPAIAVPVEELDPEECWTLGEFEERLAMLQGDGKRVRLRDLFNAG